MNLGIGGWREKKKKKKQTDKQTNKKKKEEEEEEEVKATPSQSVGPTKSKISLVIKIGNKCQTCHLKKLWYF